MGGTPLFISKAKGARIYDADGNSYIDYVGSWGALILGHAHDKIVEAVSQYAALGTSFGAPTELETELAELIVGALPSIEMLRFVNSGTEATMSAIRLARGFTGRTKIIKFEGCYHGHVDYLLARAGSGVATFALPNSAGIPDAFVRDTLLLPFNDVEALSDLFKVSGNDVAGTIVEPIAGNMGVIPATREFLKALRELSDRYGSLLIFDEVITGFRVGYGGAQSLYEIEPDLTCLGKIIGGGLPVGAYGGKAEIMRKVTPLGPVYQAGTLSGNPLSMAAGIATLNELNDALYERLEITSKRLTDGFRKAAEDRVPMTANAVGSMIGLFFTKKDKIANYRDAESCSRDAYTRFFWGMLEGGVYLPPSPFESLFVSSVHDDQNVSDTIRVSERALQNAVAADAG